ncbi:MAG: protein kinase [Candidatus Symbiothrix sp.]|jgi:hypothetical protein|nr:protein kinase [Candidatus Symbiothrix sp.]
MADSNKIELMENDLYIFPKHFFMVAISKMITNSLLQKEEMDTNSFLLINKKGNDIYVINSSIKCFLENFRKPNTILNLARKIDGGSLQNDEINTVLKDFFSQMVHRKILITSKMPVLKPKKRKWERHIGNFAILYILQRSEDVTIAIAQDTERNEKVVVKYIHDHHETVDAKKIHFFRQEFEIMGKIGQHALIRSLIAFDKDKNLAVLEYVKGRTLQDLILIGKLKIKHKLYLACQVIKVLSFLHENQIVHGDIHLKQFIVDPQLNVKLIDFGYSAICSEGNVISGVKGGINYYIEPEHISANVFTWMKDYVHNFQIDIYRMGILIYFLVYEEYPFKSFSWKYLCKLIASKELSFELSFKGELVPSFLIAIIKKSLAGNPEMRYNSATEVSSVFDEAYDKWLLETA